MNRRKIIRIALALGILALTLGPAIAWTQFPGGQGGQGGGKRGRGFDPNALFDRIANGRDTINIADRPAAPWDPSAQQRIQQFAQQQG
ncbi:MAG: hypothetical protein ACRD36_06575, partial [Candidatus Acidiferrum sp.]